MALPLSGHSYPWPLAMNGLLRERNPILDMDEGWTRGSQYSQLMRPAVVRRPGTGVDSGEDGEEVMWNGSTLWGLQGT